MKTRKGLIEEDVIKIDITGRTNVQKDEEQTHKGDFKKIEKERRSKLR
jgi:hypothetical protein